MKLGGTKSQLFKKFKNFTSRWMSVTKIIALSAFMHSLHRVCEINAWWGSCPSLCFFSKTVCPALMEWSISNLQSYWTDSILVQFCPYFLWSQYLNHLYSQHSNTVKFTYLCVMCVLFSVVFFFQVTSTEKGIRSHFPKTVFLLALTVNGLSWWNKVLLTFSRRMTYIYMSQPVWQILGKFCSLLLCLLRSSALLWTLEGQGLLV
jgi:hypothetical protein